MPNHQPPPQGGRKIQINDPTGGNGLYANMMSVSHTREEFILEFMNIVPHQARGVLNARIIMSPGHLKRVIAALQDNLQKYENAFGKIQEAKAPEEIGFKTGE